MSLRSIRIVSLPSVSLLSLALLSAPGAVAQDVRSSETPASKPGERSRAARISEPLVFEGFVLEPSGAPALGAVVVSSAGGKAVTDALGRYRLEARVPRDADRLQVTAVGAAGRNRVASARVELPAAPRTTRVDPLLLTEGASCAARWLPTFGGETGTNDTVLALTVYDDGGGPALYAGGFFSTAGGVLANHIAKWDGSSWSALGSGTNGDVYALAVHHDDRGAVLYAGGAFTSAGGVSVGHIAKWDGSSWSALGSGLGPAYGDVNALAVYDDGGGAALYAGGYFTTAGGLAARNIAKWDGSSWSALGSGTDSDVHALTVYDDGGGPKLYAGGEFQTAGGVAVNRIASWDGASWAALGSGIGRGFYFMSRVNALAVCDDGAGEALYAGGEFTSAGGVAANNIAKWDGASWEALGSGTDHRVHALTVYDDGGGPALHAGGTFTTAGGVAALGIAKWDGSSWAALGSGSTAPSVSRTPGRGTPGVTAMAVYEDDRGAALHAGGGFDFAGGVAANNIARWHGASWAALGSGMNDSVSALTAYDDGGGAALYAGGAFRSAGDGEVNHVVRWDGSSWSPLGSGLSASPYAYVNALTVYDDGGGAALYAGGGFTFAGGVAANHIAKWDGAGWSALGSGVDGSVSALTVYDDGGGPALYAGGSFTTAGGVQALRIAKWDGSSWSPLGSGTNSNVWALTVYDDGGGAALYVGGRFTRAGGSSEANGIAKWDGSSWSALGSGIGGTYPYVSALTVYDDGGGPALYAGGAFTNAGGMGKVNRIAKWDGSSWARLGRGMNGSVSALTVYDDGSGAALYAGGTFSTAGVVAARNIAKWNGPPWSALDRGVNDDVAALTVWDDGGGPALYAGGRFTTAFDSGDSYLAKWGCPAPAIGGFGGSDTPLPQPGAGGIRK